MGMSPRYFAFLVLWKTGESLNFSPVNLWITTVPENVVEKVFDKVISIRVDIADKVVVRKVDEVVGKVVDVVVSIFVDIVDEVVDRVVDEMVDRVVDMEFSMFVDIKDEVVDKLVGKIVDTHGETLSQRQSYRLLPPTT